MALYTATFSTNPALFELLAVKGGDAAELETRLLAAAAAAQPGFLVDVALAGFGAGRDWEVFLTYANVVSVGSAEGSPIFVCEDGATEAEVREKLLARFAADLSIDNIAAVLVEGSGIGPRWLGVGVGAPGE